MAWEERTVKEMREEFVRRVLAKEKSKAALCREYGISRPTGDKWLQRFQEGQPLSDRSRASKTSWPRLTGDGGEHRSTAAAIPGAGRGKAP